MKLTLGQVMTLSLLGLGAVLGALFYVLFDLSRASTIESSERIRDAASRQIVERVTSFLAKAPETAREFQLAVARGLVDPRDPAALERALLTPVLANEDIGEMTFTYAPSQGYAPDGEIRLAPAARGQWSVWRAAEARLLSRRVQQEGALFAAERREVGATGAATGNAFKREPEAVPDPTAHATFLTPASRGFHGRLLWSDLHWSQLDAARPEPQRRVEVSVQRTVDDGAGNFAGVLRVGLLTAQLGRAVQLPAMGPGARDPHRLFICDAHGRLITRGEARDPLREEGGDLRIARAAVPEPIASALAASDLSQVDEDSPLLSSHFVLGGEEYLTTFRALPETREWIAGIVVPRAFYLGKLTAMRDRLLAISLAAIALLVAGGSLILRSVRRAQGQIARESLKMNAFEFTPAPTAAPFRDVEQVLESFEKAKAAMRVMSKYAPIDLVRRLYHAKQEPVLGGETHEVSIMFTDIKDFTTTSEQLEPDRLAAALGRYLEAMAGVIQQETRGTIDKYIGDAIMSLWNAPEPVPEHERQACLAALRCGEAGRALFSSPEWAGLPPFETRFGLHTGTALVGHFGAPDRMNYTALGDAVNLASRLEGLNKVYGTSIIASEQIFAKTREQFEFRLLDFVAVKGKTQAVRIFELLGRKGGVPLHPEYEVYEEAFAAYTRRDFGRAITLLKARTHDGPCACLLRRCREFQADPPPADWAGVYFAGEK